MNVISLALFGLLSASGGDVLVEAEGFADHGGWIVDAQFTDMMGSPYLLAHGLGTPVDDAKTRVGFDQQGTYHVWVRTKDWVPSHHPGRFRVRVAGRLLDARFGTVGDAWIWQSGGTVEIDSSSVTVELCDLTGFDGRVDALLFTQDGDFTPPGDADESMAQWRRGLLAIPEVPAATETFDLVVVGGGVAGCSAALTAARLGLNVALVQNRPVLGGNASTEIGIHPAGRGGPIVDEMAGEKRQQILEAEPTLRMLVGYHAFRVGTKGERITHVDIKETHSGEELRLTAPLFVDCTGDAWIGYRAGAEFRMGREARSEFDEPLAPVEADKMTHGSTLFFKFERGEQSVTFPEVPWATAVSGDHVDLRSNHTWEYGHWLNMIDDAEHIRDHLFRAIYGTFSTAKKRFPKAMANVAMTRVNHVAARGESRRLMGDYLLTENDIRSQGPFDDAVATGSLVFCLHYQGEEHDFRNHMDLLPVDDYPIPFRCLYSRNIENLMMAGRDISATHIAYSSTKLMKTGGQMGRAVGGAAMLCRKYGLTPREVGRQRIKELQDIVLTRGKYVDTLNPPEETASMD